MFEQACCTIPSTNLRVHILKEKWNTWEKSVPFWIPGLLARVVLCYQHNSVWWRHGKV